MITLMISCHCFLLITSTRPPFSTTRLYSSYKSRTLLSNNERGSPPFSFTIYDLHISDLHLSDLRLSDLHLSDLHLSDLHLSDLHLSDFHLSDLHFYDLHLSDLHLFDLHQSDLHLSDLHLLCHDWQAVDGGSPVLHESEEIVEEAFSGWIHVELVQLPSKVIEISHVFFVNIDNQ